MNRIEYLEKLQSRMHNGLIKVITGIRRCGKSYLLFTLFKNYLLESGVPENRIISLALDDKTFTNLRNPLLLDEYIRQRITDNTTQFYLLIDEIQYCVKIKLDNMNERIIFLLFPTRNRREPHHCRVTICGEFGFQLFLGEGDCIIMWMGNFVSMVKRGRSLVW